MTVEISHPFEQMAEQLMYAKGLPSMKAAIEYAIEVVTAGLTDHERAVGLQGMIQAGFDSDVYEGDIFAELRDERHIDQVAKVRQAA